MTQVVSEFRGQYRFLSNFWPCEVELDGEVYPSVEHAYQAAKFPPDLLVGDIRARALICMCDDPATAKRKARRIRGMHRNWEDVKVAVMRKLLRQKFAPGTELGNLLAQTEGMRLEEGNWWNDTFWGISPAGSGRGINMLGQLLMQIREE